MSSTPKQIYNEVVSILTSDATLGAYVDAFYERERDALAEGKRVVVMIEPSEVWELDQYPDQQILSSDGSSSRTRARPLTTGARSRSSTWSKTSSTRSPATRA
jgi:hypothetical protein